MPSKIAAWFNSKSRSLFKKSSKSSKSWTQKIVSKLPYRQKQNAKDEWKKANQPTVESRDVVVEKLHEEDHNSKEPCTSKRSTLMTACHSGHTEKVKSLLEEDVDINEQDEEGTTALILACLGGHTEVVEMLLKKGALVDVQKADGKTALMCSSQVEVVELLLEHGAQVSLQDKEKWTALMRAADNGLTEVVQLLLEHNAQVDTQSEWRQTALMLASQKGYVEVVQLLLQHNAGVDLQDYQEWTALMLASRNGYNEVAKLLLQQGAKVDWRTEAGTALMWASEGGHEDVAKLLLEHGARVNLSSFIGETALVWACDAGHSQVAKLLLDHGAQVDFHDRTETALLRASKKGHGEVVKLLLEHCAQADLQRRNGSTALMCASEEGHCKVATLLLKHGAQVDLQNSEGETALMLASSKGHSEVVKLLVEHGAQVCIKDNYGQSILMRACRQGHADIVKMLLAQGCDTQVNEPNSRGETALMYASRGHLEVVKVLLNHSAQVDLQNIDLRTALMQASSNGHIEVVKLLLEHGAQITLQDKYGWSMLMHACCQSQTELIQLLLEQGCDAQIHKPDNFGKTALMCASEKGHCKVAGILLGRGAQVNSQDKKGRTALMHACKAGHNEVAKVLLEHDAQVNLQANKGKTALMHASKNGNCEVARLLLEHCAHVNLQAKLKINTGIYWNEITALVMTKHKEIAKLLLEHGAQVNMGMKVQFDEEDIQVATSEDATEIDLQVQGNGEGVTLLMLLMYGRISKDLDYIKFVLENGAKVDLQAKATIFLATHHEVSKFASLEHGVQIYKGEIEGITALMIAAIYRKCEVEAVEILLEHGAQIDLQTKGDIDGLTALICAAVSGNEEVARVLLKHGAQVDLQAKMDISTAFLFAVRAVGVRNVLLQHGALVDLQTKHVIEGITALMCAATSGYYDVTELLLENGAQVNIQAKGVMKGKTALILALITNHYEEAKLLLNNGADVELQDDDGWSPLQYAVQAENLEAVKLLLAHGAKVDWQNNEGWSPLMYAVQAENLEIIQLLIAHGANIHLKTSEGKMLHDICSHNLKNHSKYIQALLMTVENLELDSKFPGITFFNQPLRKALSSREDTIIGQLSDGISVYAPANALSSKDESAKLSIRPCFNGPFMLPAEYKPVSPAYLIRHSKTRFQKDITIRMHHYANLQSEKDCEDMAFLTASSTPEYRGSQLVYVFKEIPGARGVFKPGDQVGEISLQHFCLVIAGKRQRSNDSDDSESSGSSSKRHQGDVYYSARLYRSAKQFGAMFCMCLYHPIYIQHCDIMISKKYTGEISADFVQVHEDSIVINSNDPSVIFDKVPAQILKREVHLPEILKIDVGELVEYPPRLSIFVKTSQNFSSPVLQVHGLDKECGFRLLPIAITGDSTHDEDHSTLDIEDLSDVLDEVESLSSKWRLLLTKLGVKQSTLDCAKTNNIGDAKMCLYEALGEWLRLNYDHQRHGKPSWRRLVKAVSSIDCALSGTIANKHSLM